MGVRPHLTSKSPAINYAISNPSEYITNLNLFLDSEFADVKIY